MRRTDLHSTETGESATRFRSALDLVRSLSRSPEARLARLIGPGGPLLIGRAPGRLDVMGGIADYSGSVVLELPLAESTYAILQPRSQPEIKIASLREDGTRYVSTRLDDLVEGALASPQRLAAHVREAGEGWAAYVLGVVQLCVRIAARGHRGGARGFALLIRSDVPEGKGVSSSAALEVSTMVAVAAHLGLEMEDAEIAAACQWVENHVVGAPCGIMDQLTSVMGMQDRLLRLRCQPAIVEGQIQVPTGWRFFGIDSGVSHAVSGDAYSTVRAAAFMGYRIIAELAGLGVSRAGSAVSIEDPRWGGYLANVTPRELEAFEPELPVHMTGGEFLARFGGHTDAATRLHPEVAYPVRQATRHPVLENARVQRFAELLQALNGSPMTAREMGALMYASHQSYGACGLGSGGTDRLVELVREAGEAHGLFGARITGGGSGGTVAVLGRRDAEPTVRRIAARYAAEMGVEAQVFVESGRGAEVGRVKSEG